MKGKRMITLYLEETEEGSQLRVREHVYMPLRESLGLLEWAKAIILKTSDNQNALSEYAQEEL